TPGAYNYSVKILDESDGPGARYVNGISMLPSGSHYSNIVGGQIMGGLTSGLELQSYGGSGGVLSSFTISGDLLGAIYVPKLTSLTIEGDVVDEAGVITDLLSGVLTIDGSIAYEGGVDIFDMDEGSEIYLTNEENEGATFQGIVNLWTGLEAGCT